MKRLIGGAIRNLLAAACFASVLASQTESPHEAFIEEVIVEAPFEIGLEPAQKPAVRILIDLLRLRAETQRVLELQIANRTPLSALLELTKYSPIPLGGSESRVDAFFLQNHMRADLNPRDVDLLSLRQ